MMAASVTRAVVLLLLVIAYLVPGLLGHDPWKADEPYTFGVVHHMLRSGDWIVPAVGGEPFVEKPPLYYWMAGATAMAASSWLPLHDAARLASPIFVVLSLAAAAGAARLCWGEGAGALSVLLFLGTLGLESHAQRMQVDLAMLAGFAVAVLGFAACARDRAWAGIALGFGVGLGFLGKGLFAVGVIGLTALLLPLFFSQWRRVRYFEQLVYAAAVALPALVAWPLALFSRSRPLFVEWFWENNFGRFAGFAVSRLGAAYEPGSWAETLPWFLFPLWIYLIAAIVREGRRASQHAGMQIGLTMAVVCAVVLAASASMRAVYILPVVPPLVLAAVVAVRTPEGGAAKALGIFSMALGATAIVAVWGVWLALVFHWRLPAAEAIGRTLPVPFDMPIMIAAVVAAFALTAGYVVLFAFRNRFPASNLMLWVATLALGWGLALTLLLPWLDAAKSYRSVFTEVARHLPPDTSCLFVDGFGESERALVEYYTGLEPRRFDRGGACVAMVWMGRLEARTPPGPEWSLVWKGNRPAETSEHFELFVKRTAGRVEAKR